MENPVNSMITSKQLQFPLVFLVINQNTASEAANRHWLYSGCFMGSPSSYLAYGCALLHHQTDGWSPNKIMGYIKHYKTHITQLSQEFISKSYPHHQYSVMEIVTCLPSVMTVHDHEKTHKHTNNKWSLKDNAVEKNKINKYKEQFFLG